MKNLVETLAPFITWSGGPAVITCPRVTDGDHKSLLSMHNGLVAFDGGLRIFGTTADQLPTLQKWNKQDVWRPEYGELIGKNLVFFAEDVFGNQFAFDDGSVVYFNAETGKATPFASSFSQWLSIIVEDPVDTLQLSLYKSWRGKSRRLKPSQHLCPIYPFIVKANPPLHELYSVNSADDMGYKGNFANQIKDVPDGTQIRIRVID